MKTCFKYLLILAVLLMGTPGLAFSQNTVTGTVEDADGPLLTVNSPLRPMRVTDSSFRTWVMQLRRLL